MPTFKRGEKPRSRLLFDELAPLIASEPPA
jgi:hypothetical protein